MPIEPDRLATEAALRVGEVAGVTGRKILVLVDSNKNVSELFFNGDVLRNIAVGSYVDIRKGFLSLIGKVEGENAQSDDGTMPRLVRPAGKRLLTVSLVGFIDHRGKFYGGTKELPLVGNEAFLLTKERVHQIHDLVEGLGESLDIAVSEYEGYEIALPVDGLINSHIAVFGNTGSGKSNTLARLYQEFIEKMRARNATAFAENCRIVLFDFNNEYLREQCLTTHKRRIRVSTRNDDGDKIPLGKNAFTNIEIISILADATEKTQKPFLKRALRLQQKILSTNDPTNYARAVLRNQVKQMLQMSEKLTTNQLLDYLKQILPDVDADGNDVEIRADLEWLNNSCQWVFNGHFLQSDPSQIENTTAYQHVSAFSLKDDVIDDFIAIMYVQLIDDILSNRAQNEHIAPAINKLRSKQADIRKVFDSDPAAELFTSNVVVIGLGDANLEMKKTVPLLVAKDVYERHKAAAGSRSLIFIIDEAHNILSTESFREAEGWKDYRLETFEEIIKEGRKFGVFVTIASQRPSDISPTITSQAHNYFIHRLINQKDLQAISSAVSYIDRLSEESIPTLPTGTCIFSGAAGQMPLKLVIRELDEPLQPRSSTLKFQDLVPAT
jgi:hypothetical protein